MTEELLDRLYNGEEMIVTYNLGPVSYCGTYRSNEYDVYCDSELAIVYNGIELTLDLDELQKISFYPEDTEYELVFESGAEVLLTFFDD